MDAVKAIVLNLATPKEMTISPCAFKKMKRLRMLILHKVHISSQGPVRLPNALRWLEWPNALHLEFGPGPKKLARLRFQNSHIKQLVGNCQVSPYDDQLSLFKAMKIFQSLMTAPVCFCRILYV